MDTPIDADLFLALFYWACGVAALLLLCCLAGRLCKPAPMAVRLRWDSPRARNRRHGERWAPLESWVGPWDPMSSNVSKPKKDA